MLSETHHVMIFYFETYRKIGWKYSISNINTMKSTQDRVSWLDCLVNPYLVSFMKSVSHVFVNASNSDQPETHWLLFAQTVYHFFLQIHLDKDYTIIHMFTNTWDILFIKETKYWLTSQSNQLTRSCVDFIIFMVLMLYFHPNFL